jgi:LemA protein
VGEAGALLFFLRCRPPALSTTSILDPRAWIRFPLGVQQQQQHILGAYYQFTIPAIPDAIFGWLIAPGLVVLALVVWCVLIFNRLVKHRNLVREGWSLIDVQLKKRHDLVPRLVETVRAYAGHERATLREMTAMRSSALHEREVAENQVASDLRGLLAVAEAYPQLKANENFILLHKELVDIEDQLEMARRYYNGAVRDYNIRIESIPSRWVAQMTGFTPADFFEIQTATERQTPAVAI